MYSDILLVCNIQYVKYVNTLSYPNGSGEGILEVVGDAHEQSLSAGDHGHASSKVTHHVVGC